MASTLILLWALQVNTDSTASARALARLLDDAKRYKVEQSIVARQRYGTKIEHRKTLRCRSTDVTSDSRRTTKVGEYASESAGEMGRYADPYERYGRLGMEMFLAADWSWTPA